MGDVSRGTGDNEINIHMAGLLGARPPEDGGCDLGVLDPEYCSKETHRTASCRPAMPCAIQHKTSDSMRPQRIDKDKLRAAMRKMPHQYIYQMLDDAVDLLPPTKLIKLVKSYIPLDGLQPDRETTGGLLASVERFRDASFKREYFESFDVNWKNSTQISKKTGAWIADCKRLLGNCVAATSRGHHEEARQALEILFDLLRQLDGDPDSIIFFADEAGAWQVGCDWRRIMPAWFKCLAASTGADKYAAEVVRSVQDLVGYDYAKYFAMAKRVATPEQRHALKAATPGAS